MGLSQKYIGSLTMLLLGMLVVVDLTKHQDTRGIKVDAFEVVEFFDKQTAHQMSHVNNGRAGSFKPSNYIEENDRVLKVMHSKELSDGYLRESKAIKRLRHKEDKLIVDKSDETMPPSFKKNLITKQKQNRAKRSAFWSRRRPNQPIAMAYDNHERSDDDQREQPRKWLKRAPMNRLDERQKFSDVESAPASRLKDVPISSDLSLEKETNGEKQKKVRGSLGWLEFGSRTAKSEGSNDLEFDNSFVLPENNLQKKINKRVGDLEAWKSRIFCKFNPDNKNCQRNDTRQVPDFLDKIRRLTKWSKFRSSTVAPANSTSAPSTNPSTTSAPSTNPSTTSSAITQEPPETTTSDGSSSDPITSSTSSTSTESDLLTTKPTSTTAPTTSIRTTSTAVSTTTTLSPQTSTTASPSSSTAITSSLPPITTTSANISTTTTSIPVNSPANTTITTTLATTTTRRLTIPTTTTITTTIDPSSTLSPTTSFSTTNEPSSSQSAITIPSTILASTTILSTTVAPSTSQSTIILRAKRRTTLPTS